MPVNNIPINSNPVKLQQTSAISQNSANQKIEPSRLAFLVDLFRALSNSITNCVKYFKETDTSDTSGKISAKRTDISGKISAYTKTLNKLAASSTSEDVVNQINNLLSEIDALLKEPLTSKQKEPLDVLRSYCVFLKNAFDGLLARSTYVDEKDNLISKDDGHCFFHSVLAQLILLSKDNDLNFRGMRKNIAEYMTRNIDDDENLLELVKRAIDTYNQSLDKAKGDQLSNYCEIFKDKKLLEDKINELNIETESKKIKTPQEYIKGISENLWGGDPEIYVVQKIFGTNVELFFGVEDKVFTGERTPKTKDINLVMVNNNHWNTLLVLDKEKEGT
jgi:hypothetical protein